MEGIKDLRDCLRYNTLQKKRVCKITGLSAKKLKARLSVPKRFTLYEIVGIKKALSLSMDEVIKIFAPFVAKHNKREETEADTVD